MNGTPTIHGLMAEFLTADEVLAAVRAARQSGYRQMDAYTPYPVEGLATELGLRRSRIPSVVLMTGLTGACVGFFMQYYSMAINYPFNVGGRPYNSWPVFIPITFELMVLLAAFGAFLGMMLLNGLPHMHHAVFNVPNFARASQDRFFFCIETTDAQFDHAETAAFLSSLSPHGEIIVVPMNEPSPPAQPEAVS